MDFLKDRGLPWEYDPGPPANRQWARLFAETPNYRGLGRELGGGEEFRWHFGPMFYRGRLTNNTARVLVIGQEGAQDESLGHRSFVGGTGARMQHVLRHIGITQSYLFLNTFVYPSLASTRVQRFCGLPRTPSRPSSSRTTTKVVMPTWAFQLAPAPLSDDERAAIEDAPHH